MNTVLNTEKFIQKMKELLARAILVDELNMPINLETNLVNGVGENCLPLSSIDYVDFLVMVETEYDIVYDFDTTIYTIGDLYHYICNYRAGMNHNE